MKPNNTKITLRYHTTGCFLLWQYTAVEAAVLSLHTHYRMFDEVIDISGGVEN